MKGKEPTRPEEQKSFQAEILAVIPHLRAFARSLTRNREEADDLVHDAVVRALSAAQQFTPGTNFRAWMFTILRNLFYNEIRRRHKRTVSLETADIPEPSHPAHQEESLVLCDFRRAFWQLNPQYREILILVGASGLSYEQASIICHCQVGTIKSRVSRARAQLTRILNEGTLEKRRKSRPITVNELSTMLESSGLRLPPTER